MEEIKILDKENAINNNNIFKFNNQEVRAVLVDQVPFFVAKDVCDILEIKNSRQALSRLDKDEKAGVILNDGRQNRKMSAVNESGLYGLVFSSHKPEAKEFRKWVTNEVLPVIRKTGGYVQEDRAIDFVDSWLPQLDDTTRTVIASTLEENRKLVLENKKLVTTVEEQAPKVEAYHDFLDSTGHIKIGDFGKQIGIGRNTIFKYMRRDGVLMQGDQHNIPKQHFMKYFKVISVQRRNSTIYDPVALLNIKGADHFFKKYVANK